MLQYGLNVLLEYGTAIFIFDLKSIKEGENKLVYELKPMKTDITLNPKFYDQEFDTNLIEYSLKQYLSFLYISYPEKVEIYVNGSLANLNNNYSKLKLDFPKAMTGKKTDKYAI